MGDMAFGLTRRSPKLIVASSPAGQLVEDWVTALQRGQPEAAWDLFLGRYRRLIFAAIRHYAQDYDDVMDVFTRVCEALREDDFRRLRAYAEQPTHRARFSTWLVTVVRHLTIDWFRHRDGRRRLPAIAEGLPPLRRRIFEHVFMHGRSHLEAYELTRSAEGGANLTFRQFLTELRATYQAVTDGRHGHLLGELGGAIASRMDPRPRSRCVRDECGRLRRYAVDLRHSQWYAGVVARWQEDRVHPRQRDLRDERKRIGDYQTHQ